jgi:hypothetical protein
MILSAISSLPPKGYIVGEGEVLLNLRQYWNSDRKETKEDTEYRQTEATAHCLLYYDEIQQFEAQEKAATGGRYQVNRILTELAEELALCESATMQQQGGVLGSV